MVWEGAPPSCFWGSPLLFFWLGGPRSPFSVSGSPFRFLVGRSPLTLSWLRSPFPFLFGWSPLSLLVGRLDGLAFLFGCPPPPRWGSPHPGCLAVSPPLLLFWEWGGGGGRGGGGLPSSPPPFRLGGLHLPFLIPCFWMGGLPSLLACGLPPQFLLKGLPLSFLVGSSLLLCFWSLPSSRRLPGWAVSPPRSLGPPSPPSPLLFGDSPPPRCLGRLPSLLGWPPFWVRGLPFSLFVERKEKREEKKKKKKKKKRTNEKKKKKNVRKKKKMKRKKEEKNRKKGENESY